MLLERGTPGGKLHGDEGETGEIVRGPAFSLIGVHFLNAPRSKSSAAGFERDMYAPLSGVLNLGLEGLSKIDVDGLPKFQDHIVFIPLDEGVTSDRALDGSSFKPDVAIMLFTTACDFRNVSKHSKVSEFVDKIPEKTRSKMAPPEAAPIENVPPKTNAPQDPPKADPSSRIGWKDILSAVEVKRGSKAKWPKPGNFTDTIAPTINDGSDEQFLRSRTPNPETSSDVSQSQTRKIHALVDGAYH